LPAGTTNCVQHKEGRSPKKEATVQNTCVTAAGSNIRVTGHRGRGWDLVHCTRGSQPSLSVSGGGGGASAPPRVPHGAPLHLGFVCAGVLNDDQQVVLVGRHHDLVLVGPHTKEGQVILQQEQGKNVAHRQSSTAAGPKTARPSILFPTPHTRHTHGRPPLPHTHRCIQRTNHVPGLRRQLRNHERAKHDTYTRHA
jgi:hypothetical protein